MIRTQPELNALDSNSNKAPWQTPLLKQESSESGAVKVLTNAETTFISSVGPAS